MRCSKNSSNREVYRNKTLPQETRKISNKPPILTPKATREGRKNKTQISRRNEITNITAEINEIEMKTIAKISPTKS